MADHGFVYLLGNKEMPGLIKVGMTNRSPYMRASELSSPTGVPAKFELLAFFACENPREYEKSLHTRLVDSRVSLGKEFFRCCLADVYFAIEGLVSVITPVGADRFAEEMIEWIDAMQPPLEEQLHFASLISKKDWDYSSSWITHKTGVNFDEYLKKFYLDGVYQNGQG